MLRCHSWGRFIPTRVFLGVGFGVYGLGLGFRDWGVGFRDWGVGSRRLQGLVLQGFHHVSWVCKPQRLNYLLAKCRVPKKNGAFCYTTNTNKKRHGGIDRKRRVSRAKKTRPATLKAEALNPKPQKGPKP